MHFVILLNEIAAREMNCAECRKVLAVDETHIGTASAYLPLVIYSSPTRPSSRLTVTKNTNTLCQQITSLMRHKFTRQNLISAYKTAKPMLHKFKFSSCKILLVTLTL